MLDRNKFTQIISDISYKDWALRVNYVEHTTIPGFLVTPVFWRKDVVSGQLNSCKNMRSWFIETWRDEAYVVQTIFAMFKLTEEHEIREAFTYKGEQLYSPHKIESLLNETR